MKRPGLLLSLFPVILMVGLLGMSVAFFKDGLTSGPAQIAIMFTCMVTCIIGVYHLKIPWSRFEEEMGGNMSTTTAAIVILLAIGAMTATWMLSGIVPTMIYYGLKLISPKIFFLASFLLCGLISVLAGSSWTTVGTIGVALVGAGHLIGLPLGWVAGSVISGAYMGDKISPLSDTTNISASVAGVDLYTHVKFNLITTIPAFVICVVVYTIVGFIIPPASPASVAAQLEALEGTFNISPWFLLIPCVTIFLIYKKVPAFITLFFSAVVAAVVTCFAQPEVLSQIGTDGSVMSNLLACIKMMGSSTSLDTGDALIDALTSTGGMAGMINTVWLIICVMVMGGALQASGMLEVITNALLKGIKSVVGMVITTVCTCFCSNMVMPDQYMGIVLPGNMFRDAYRKRSIAPEMLSRTLQDSATVSSVLIPWNTCGVVQAGVLGVATLQYAPYSVFCYITPFIAIIIAAVGYKIRMLPVENQINK